MIAIKSPTKDKGSIITNKIVILFAVVYSLIYISWWFRFSNVGNHFLYGVLLAGEIYYLFMTFGYWFTVWDTSFKRPRFVSFSPTVNIFIPVCGEPIHVIENTITAVLRMKYDKGVVAQYPDKVKIYILNDGFVAKKDNWRIVDNLSSKYPIHVITRKTPGGAKAGNINNALQYTDGEYVVIFDSDQRPFTLFFKKLIGFFIDPRLGFVQTPQYYQNHEKNFVTKGAWAQQELFFGPICRGKNRLNATFCCGTNVIFRRKALMEVHGFDTSNIAEDFATSVNIHSKGWKTLYYPKILARGLAPMNLEEYYSQQLRWAKGSIDVFFKNNPIFKRNLSFAQRVQYLLSLGYYLMGTFMIIDALIPVIFLYTGIIPVRGSSASYILLFFPYILFIVYILSASTEGRLNYRALQFSIGSFYIQFTALISSMLGRKVGFKVTSKSTQSKERSYPSLVWPHLLYIALGISAIIYAMLRDGINPALVTNTSWILFNIIMISAHVYAAFPWLGNIKERFEKIAFTSLLYFEDREEQLEEPLIS